MGHILFSRIWRREGQAVGTDMMARNKGRKEPTERTEWSRQTQGIRYWPKPESPGSQYPMLLSHPQNRFQKHEPQQDAQWKNYSQDKPGWELHKLNPASEKHPKAHTKTVQPRNPLQFTNSPFPNHHYIILHHHCTNVTWGTGTVLCGQLHMWHKPGTRAQGGAHRGWEH